MDCSPLYTDELDVLHVNYELVHFGQAFNSLPNATYKLATNNCITWTYDFYCEAVRQCVEAQKPVVGYIWRTLIAPAFNLVQ